MSLKFNVEEIIRPLVSTMYETSDEVMGIDIQSATEIDKSHDEDSDIAVIVCYRETPVYPPQLVASGTGDDSGP